MTTGARRLAALGALLLLGVAVAATVVAVIGHPWRIPVAVALLAAALVAGWFALTRTGTRRALAGLLALGGVAAFVVVSFGSSGLVSILGRVALVLAAVALVRYVVAHDPGLRPRNAAPPRTVPPAGHGALIMNLKSGGGKAARFGLEEQCRARGIAGIVLQPGDDLLELAEKAVDGGADVIGMAGGDGSQALVASVAARRGVAMVVVPAGTRNHLALDLGLDRDDVVGALDAFGEAVEQPMDLAEVNGRVFVNNVSLGLYASIVRSPAYRNAKFDTALGALPTALGPGSTPFDLRFTGPDGEPTTERTSSRSPTTLRQDRRYPDRPTQPRYGPPRGGGPRAPAGDRAAESFMAAIAVNRPERFRAFLAWEPTTFRVDSEARSTSASTAKRSGCNPRYASRCVPESSGFAGPPGRPAARPPRASWAALDGPGPRAGPPSVDPPANRPGSRDRRPGAGIRSGRWTGETGGDADAEHDHRSARSPAGSARPSTTSSGRGGGRPRGRRCHGRATAEFTAGADRPDPVALLERQGRTGSPSCCRSATAEWLVAVHVLPRRRTGDGRGPGPDPRAGLTVQICGDAHLVNFGVFASPERNLVFDINDFDETARPMGVGCQAAGCQRGDRRTRNAASAIGAARGRLGAARAYRLAMRGFAAMGNGTSGTRTLTADSLKRLTDVQLGAASAAKRERAQGSRQGLTQGARQASTEARTGRGSSTTRRSSCRSRRSSADARYDSVVER